MSEINTSAQTAKERLLNLRTTEVVEPVESIGPNHTMMWRGISCTEAEFTRLEHMEAIGMFKEGDKKEQSLGVQALLAEWRKWKEPEVKEPEVASSTEGEYTGGSSSYYQVWISNPTTKTNQAYLAECNDIIEALGMNYAEGSAFKALWRKGAARIGKLKKGYDNGLYDSEKVEFFGARMVEQAKKEV